MTLLLFDIDDLELTELMMGPGRGGGVREGKPGTRDCFSRT